MSALSNQTEEDEIEYLRENDKIRESESNPLGAEDKEKETFVKENNEESIKAEKELSEE